LPAGELTLDVVVTAGDLAILVDLVLWTSPGAVEVGLDGHVGGGGVECAGVGWGDGRSVAEGVEEVLRGLLEHFGEWRGCFSQYPAAGLPHRSLLLTRAQRQRRDLSLDSRQAQRFGSASGKNQLVPSVLAAGEGGDGSR